MFSISISVSTKSRIAATKRTVKSFTVIGVDITGINILYSFWMLRARCFVLGTLRSSFMCLGAFVFYPYLCSFLERPARTPSFSCVEQFKTYLKQNNTVSTLSISDQSYIARSVNEFLQDSEGLPEKLAILFTTLKLPKKTTGVSGVLKLYESWRFENVVFSSVYSLKNL